ncbi:hypothetical protein C2E23DRAFT_880801 [Lenzites betulinus]|nr:hypothetical protein C2E23DRAFT_880801 [Lenzites betulinus]
MNHTPQNDSNAFGGQNRMPESWNNLDNSGGNAGMRDQNNWSTMATDGTASTVRGPGGVFASHGGQLGTDTDFNAGPTMMGGTAAPRAAAGRDDNFGSNAPNFRGGPGPALPGGAAPTSEDRDMNDPGATLSGNPGMGNKFVGTIEKAAGRVSGNSNMVNRGQMRKTGRPQADDTLL